MQKKSVYILTFFAVVTLTLIMYVTGTNASATAEKEIEQTFKNLFTAIDNKDVGGMIKYSLDTRFTDDAVRRNEYAELLSTDQVELEKVIEIKRINDENYQITAEITTKDNGTTTLEFPVRRSDDGKWKIELGQDVPASTS